MRKFEAETGFKTLLKTLGFLSVALLLAATSGCGDDDADSDGDGDASAEGGSGGDQAGSVPTAKPGTPEAAVYAALDDATTRLKKADVYGFMEHYAPVSDIARMRRSKESMDEAVQELTEKPERLNMLIDIFQRARKGTIEFDESGSTATIVLPVPEVKTEPEPPVSVIKEPVLTNAKLSGYGGDIGEVVGKALAALNAGESEAFVANMFPASELRHPDAAAQQAILKAKLAASPEMIEQMKTDLAAISELTPKMEDGGKTAVFALAGGEIEYGRGKITLPNRTFKFQLVEGSWRLFDNTTAIRKEISRQSALSPPEFEGPEEISGDYIQFERLGDQWRLGKIQVRPPRN
ncbi:MAG: hypothetical protein O2820_15215 [Planctomycetota bacterium]|nr:hypothetical protein [Planctomycetota bacterium]